jgi:adenine-specific DNA-methyltransferase
MAGTAESVEALRQGEQGRLDGLKSADERNRLGQFATPNRLAVEMARYALRLWDGREEPVRFLDPSIGTGSFYSALRQVFPAGMIADGTGVEIDPAFAQAASDLWGPLGLAVTTADFTRLPPPPPGRRPNLVLANPPYVRHHHLAQDEKRRLKGLVRQGQGIDISGLAGLYGYFLLLGDAWLADGGLAFWLIPSEFMDVNYGAAIKHYLTERVRLLHIHRFCPSDVQFFDALVTSAVVIFQKAAPTAEQAVRVSFGGSLLDPETSEPVPLGDLRAARKWTNYPAARGVVAMVGPQAATLGDLFTIRRGQATGSNSFFILPRDEALQRGIPVEFLKPILPSPRHLRTSVVEADADGFPLVDRPLGIIDCDLSEDEVRRRHPAFWGYLEGGAEQGVSKGYLASRRTPWYSQEKREPPPFVCTYMGRQRGGSSPFRIIWNKSRATAANVYLLLYPRGILKRALDARPDLYPVVFSLLQGIKAHSFIDEGRVYGGGLHKMEPKELAFLPAQAIVDTIGQPPAARQATLFS